MKNETKEERILQREEEIKQMSHLIGAMAHQWKQPLNILGLLIQDIKDAYEFKEIDDAYLEQFVSRGMENVRTISHSIDDFRSFFTPKFKSETIEIHRVVKEIIAMLSHQYQSHKIKLELSGDTLEITAYTNTFRQAIMNILGTIKDIYDESKACDKKITIQIDGNAKTIRIEEGCGVMDQTMIQKVFAKEMPALSDLGIYAPLFNARMFLSDAADATLRAEQEEKATVFVITLPNT